MITHWNNPEQIKQLLIRLAEIPSITGTAGEVDTPSKIGDILRELSYFQQNFSNLAIHSVPDDSLGRSFVTALVRGKQTSRKTVVLLSHFDVVGVDDFGVDRDYAFRPEEYTQRLLAKSGELPADVRADLQAGDWLFGRGTMDMKAGLAIQIAVLSQLAADNKFSGNVLLVAVPDEERNSAGMLAAVPTLNRLQKTHRLEYELCICSEPSFAELPGDKSNYIYLGSVGKLLPMIFCVGKETHVGEPLEGLNAALMVAEAINQIELSEEFVEEYAGEMVPPPTCLKVSDLKNEYNVQTPTMAYALYNVLTVQQTPAEVLSKVKKSADTASFSIAKRLRKQYQRLGLPDADAKANNLQPKIFTYQQLYERGKSEFGEEFEQSIRAIIADSRVTSEYGEITSEDERDTTVRVAAKISSYFMHDAPFYLLLFAPPYYPHVYVDTSTDKGQTVMGLVQKVTLKAQELGEELKIKTFFTGLSDVCYAQIHNPQQVIPVLKENLPLFDVRYHIPFDEIVALNLPTINIGPHGKDAHKRTERLELTYSTQITPQLLLEAINGVLR